MYLGEYILEDVTTRFTSLPLKDMHEDNARNEHYKAPFDPFDLWTPLNAVRREVKVITETCVLEVLLQIDGS